MKKTIFAFNWFDVRTTNQTCEGWCFCDSSRTTGRIAAALWDGCAAAACCFCECVCCKLLRLSVARQMVQGLLLMEGVYNCYMFDVDFASAGAVCPLLAWPVDCVCQMAVGGFAFLGSCFAIESVCSWYIWNLTQGNPMILHKISSWKGNEARNLQRLITAWGLSLMVQPHMQPCPVKFRGGTTWTLWPWLKLSSWLKLIFERTEACMLCNGLPLGEHWRYELRAFWSMYEKVCPMHPAFRRPDRLEFTLPFAYHGDEGRGRLKRAVLITSYQPILVASNASFKSRLLCSIFPGERYACLDGVETLEALHEAVANDLVELAEDGMQAVLLSYHDMLTFRLCILNALLTSTGRYVFQMAPNIKFTYNFAVSKVTGHGNDAWLHVWWALCI